MKNLPPLSSITAFIQVASTGAFNEAARQLGLTSSATSKAVSRLEHHLGVKLMQRTTRSITLTPEGERYLEGMRRVIEEINTVGHEVSSTSADPAGRLRISAPPAFGRLCLIEALISFRQQWPKIKVELTLDDRTVDLAGEAVDIVIRSGSLADADHLIARKLFNSSLLVCASPDYWEKQGRPGHPDELVNHQCLNFRNTRNGRIYPWSFRIDGTSYSQTHDGPLEVDDGEAVVTAARNGMGVSQMPDYLAKRGIESGQLEEVLKGFRPPDIPYHAAYLDRRLLSPRIRVFIDFLVQWQF